MSSPPAGGPSGRGGVLSQGRRAQLGEGHPRTMAAIRGFAELLKEQGKRADEGGEEGGGGAGRPLRPTLLLESQPMGPVPLTPRLNELLQQQGKLGEVQELLRTSAEDGNYRGTALRALANHALLLRCAPRRVRSLVVPGSLCLGELVSIRFLWLLG